MNMELQDPPAVEYCPHGYDIACLICGFGQKDGKRVWHNKKPKAEVSIRTNESDFAVGDWVVLDFAVPHLKNHKLIKITADDIGKPYTNNYKHASDEEIATGYRIEQPMVDLELKAPEPKLYWFLIGYNWRGNSASGFGNLRIPSLTKEVYERDFKTIKDDIQSTHALCLEIVVLSISYLGYMTNTEFYQQPDSEEL